MIDEAACHSIPVISIKQEFEGHAHQAAMVAAACSEIANWAACKYIIVIDEDIDPTNVSEVLWALATRTDPEISIDVVRGFRSTLSDPILSPDKKRRGDLSHSKAIICACRPYHWIKEFPLPCRASPGYCRKRGANGGRNLIWLKDYEIPQRRN